jgi:DNA modification methylase
MKRPSHLKVTPRSWAKSKTRLEVEYATGLGAAIVGKSEEILKGPFGKTLKGKVQLVFTSPPFPLNRKKRYGNVEGNKFKAWLKRYAKLLKDLLTPDGSIVIEMGNAWQPGLPVMSTLALETLLAFKREAGLYLCQEFIWYNPAKLPTPAQWVTIERIRVKDAFTRLWWLSPNPRPKADNRRVLIPYSEAMRSLLKTKKYNAGLRPSQHNISATSFLKKHRGASPPNVLSYGGATGNLLIGSNTHNVDPYYDYCKALGVAPHPARMPVDLAKFFIQLCTESGDLVLDPFAGSNTTGAAAEALKRRWVAVEAEAEYAKASLGRFPSLWDRKRAVKRVRRGSGSR